MPAEPTPAKPDPLIGRKVGGYAITRKIGQGGMGVVYEAKHERMSQQRAAIKVLHKELSSDEKVLQRFFMEAKAISMAQHSSIVKIFDFGQIDDGTAYIMMEFLEGEPLQSRMERAQQRSESLPLSQVIELGRQSATALSVIHEKNIVHRDLKPENIFVVPDPVAPLGERVKLLDFGIAKFLDGPVRKTTVGMILGTPLYMSPEQCEGSEDLDAKVDVYALGVMLYEMIAGHLPFSADTAAALMRQHMFKEPPQLAEQVAGLPTSLTSLIHLMLAKKPSDRPRMVEVADRLEQILAECPELQGGVHALSGVNITGRRRALSQSGQGPLDPFAKTMGSSGELDPFASTLSEPRLLGKSRSDSGVGAVPAAASQGSLDQAKPAATPRPVSLTLGQGRGRAALYLSLVGVAVLCVGIVLLLRPAHRTTAGPKVLSAVPPVATGQPRVPSASGAHPTGTASSAKEPGTIVASDVAAASQTSEPDPKASRVKKRKGGSKKALSDGEDKKPKTRATSSEKPSGEQEVWR
ncbi:MAG: serine/threonine protein kinase [Myxococcales bacterium]|nr:serine/threonine protein kinase [Myxococcales bacterium]